MDCPSKNLTFLSYLPLLYYPMDCPSKNLYLLKLSPVVLLTYGLSFQEFHLPQYLPLFGSHVHQHMIDNTLSLLACEESLLLLHPLKTLLLIIHELSLTPAILLSKRFTYSQVFCSFQQTEIKAYDMGCDARKPVFGDLRTTKGQTSLCIRTD